MLYSFSPCVHAIRAIMQVALETSPAALPSAPQKTPQTS
jgi:hypothetical protein